MTRRRETSLSPLAVALIDRLAPPAWRESIAGDLAEEHAARRAAGRSNGVAWQIVAAATAAGRLRREHRKELDLMRRPLITSLRSLEFEWRQALRVLRRRPAFTTITVLTLALGIGAGTGVFTLANWLMFRPVPGVSHPDGLVTVRLEFASGGFYTMSMAEYRAVAALPAWRALGAAADASFHVSTGEGAPVRVEGAVVTSNYFDVLEQRPAAGRTFGLADDQPANAEVAIISDNFWTNQLGAAPNVVGRRLTINGHPFTIVGVAARGFRGPDRSGRADLWVPVASFRSSMPSYPATLLSGTVGIFFSLLGRPQPGVTAASITGQLKSVRAGLALASPKSGKYARSAFQAHDGLDVPAWQRDGLRQMFALLLGASALLLLLTCANVANLFFAHAHERAGELATRQALGAGRSRVIRQLLLEALVLSAVGGVLALAFAAGLGRWIDGLVIARNLPALSAINLDWRVFTFAAAVSIATAVAASLGPAFVGSRLDLASALKSTGRSGSIARSRRVRRVLTFVQVAVSVLLLTVGTLLVRSVLARYRVPLGYDAGQVLAFSIDASVQGYSKDRTVSYMRDTLEALHQMPGVSHAGLAYIEPFRMVGGGVSLTAVGAPAAREVIGDTNMVSEDFFPALGVRFVAGRDFRPEEVFHSDSGGGGVVILNDAMARALFGTPNIVGRQVTATFPETRALTVVGVVADIRTRDVSSAPVKPTAFEPFGQSFLSGWGTFHVRLAGPSAPVAAALRDVMRRVDPNLPVYDIELVSSALDRHLAEGRLLARTIETLALLATLVAALGLYGVLSRSVEERRREFGIRVALGARPATMARLVTSEALLLSIGGGLAGAAGALWVGRLIESRLYGVQPFDALSFGVAAAVAIGTALAASGPPAARAARVDVVGELR